MPMLEPWRGERPFSELNTHANVVALLGTKVPRKRERVVKCKKKGKILNVIVP
jgi:hypothetical protein